MPEAENPFGLPDLAGAEHDAPYGLPLLRMAPAHRPSTEQIALDRIREQDLPIEPVSHPGEWAIAGGPAAVSGRLLNPLLRGAPWLLQSAARNAAAGATMGVVEDLSRGRNPVPGVLPNAAAGAVTGPVLEGAGGAIMRGTRGILKPRPVESPAPKVSAPVESTPGALKPFSGPIAEPALPPRPTPPVDRTAALNMAPEELAAAAKAEKAWERQGAVDVFGPEQAKVYERNYSLADRFDLPEADRRAASKIVQEMEASLTDAQRNRLFGVGEDGFNAEDLRMLANAASDYHPEGLTGMSDAELRNHLARAMTEKDVLGANSTSTRQAIVLRNTLMEAQRRGWGPQQIQDAILERARALRMDPAEIAGLAQQRMDDLAKPVAAGALPPKPAPIPGAVPPPSAAPAEVPLGPAKPTNAQQFPQLGEFRAQMEADPAYQTRLRELGGGKVVTNNETLAEAWRQGPMAPEELAAWKADAPVNPVIQTRALLTFDYFQRQRTQAMLRGDWAEAKAANETISKLMPGVTNIRATGPRTTQAQAMFVQDEMTKAINQLSDMHEKGIPFEQVRAKAQELVAQAEAAKRKAGATKLFGDWLENVQTAATAAKLTSAVTHANNTISNLLTFSVIRPLEKGGTAATLLVQGDRAAAHAEVSRLFGTMMGYRSGLRRYVSAILDETPDVGALQGETAHAQIPLPKLLRPLDPFRQLSGADAFWKGVFEDAYLYERAFESAGKEGLKGPQFAARVNALRTNAPEQWLREARANSQEFTFQSPPDGLLKPFQKIQKLPLVRLFIPFVSTPYNVGKFQFERSAAGLIAPRNVTGLAAGGRAQAEAVGRLTAGFALSAGALSLVSSTDVTGDYPDDPKQRAVWSAQGIRPYSIRIGKHWLQYSRFSPLGIYLGQAVSLRDALNSGDDNKAQAIASNLMASTAQQIMDMPFMSGLSDLMDALKGDGPNKKAPQKFVEGVATGFVPNALTDVRMQTDPVMRKPEGLLQAVKNKIPGQSQDLPAAIDVLGNERRYESSRLLRASKSVYTERSTPEGALLARLQWAPEMPEPELKKKGFPTVRLAGKDLERYLRVMGKATREAIAPFVKDPAFLRLDRDEQIERLNKAVNDARAPIREEWKFDRITMAK